MTLLDIHNEPISVYVLLYSVPSVLRKDQTTMRRIIEIFDDFSAVETGLDGPIHNLFQFWAPFPAAIAQVKTVDCKKVAQEMIQIQNTSRQKLESIQHLKSKI